VLGWAWGFGFLEWGVESGQGLSKEGISASSADSNQSGRAALSSTSVSQNQTQSVPNWPCNVVLFIFFDSLPQVSTSFRLRG